MLPHTLEQINPLSSESNVLSHFETKINNNINSKEFETGNLLSLFEIMRKNGEIETDPIFAAQLMFSF